MHRLFLALRPPPPIIDTAIDLMDEAVPVGWQDDEQLHITLRFIGEVERPVAEDLASALSAFHFHRFEVSLRGVGCFARRRGGALWAGVTPKEPLRALTARLERLCQGLGLPPEHRAFHPHLTLARWSGGQPAETSGWLQQHAEARSAAWTAERIILFESRLSRSGAHYEEVMAVAASG